MLLKELISSTCKMSIAEGLNSFDPSLRSLVELLYGTMSICRNAASKGSYYEIVRRTIANNFESSFDLRRLTGEW